MNKKSAFTFIELSIVLVIIMILTVGILKGASLAYSSRLLGARSQTAKSIIPEVKGLVAWYEISLKDSFIESEASDETQITQWNDIGPSLNSSRKNNLTKSASSNVLYIEDGINNIPSIKFDALTTDSNITLPSFYQNYTPQSTIFIVFQPLGTLPTQETLLDSGAAVQDTVSISVESDAVTINAGIALSGATSVNSGQTYILCASFNRTLSAVYFNDADTKLTSGDAGANSLNGLTIGSNKSSSERFDGLVSEVVVYDRVISLQERRDIFRYLADKYDVTVDGI